MKVISTCTLPNTTIDLKCVRRVTKTSTRNEIVFCTLHYDTNTETIKLSEDDYDKLVVSFEKYTAHVASIAPQTLNVDTFEIMDIIGPELKERLGEQLILIVADIDKRASELIKNKTDIAVQVIQSQHLEVISLAKTQAIQISSMTVQVDELTKKLTNITEVLESLITIK